MNLSQIIDRMFGEQNLYKMDPWKDVNKSCKHGNHVFCDKCREELNKENKLKK